MKQMKQIRNISLENDYFDYNRYKLSNLWINSRLKKNIDSALEKGTQLYDAHRCNIFWNKFPNINGINDYYFDYDLRYYIVTDVYGWSLPSKREINLILQYSKNKTILDLGTGTGFFSKLLSHYRKVLPIDTKEEQFDFEYIDIIQEDSRNISPNNNQFVLLNFPRKHVITNAFKQAELGTRFYITNSFAGMDFNANIVKWIYDSSVVLEDNIQCWTDSKITDHFGVIVEKRKQIPLDIYPEISTFLNFLRQKNFLID